jgi:methyltransferase-like protein
MRYPKQLGIIGKTKRGNIMLTNPKGESFNVHKTVAYIWENASGTMTAKDIADMLINALEIPKEQRDTEAENVILALRDLERKGLMEYRQGN